MIEKSVYYDIITLLYKLNYPVAIPATVFFMKLLIFRCYKLYNIK